MCLGIPMRIVEREGNDAVAMSSSVRKRIRLDLLEGAAVGDYVLIHAGYAIEVLDLAEAATQHAGAVPGPALEGTMRALRQEVDRCQDDAAAGSRGRSTHPAWMIPVLPCPRAGPLAISSHMTPPPTLKLQRCWSASESGLTMSCRLVTRMSQSSPLGSVTKTRRKALSTLKV